MSLRSQGWVTQNLKLRGKNSTANTSKPKETKHPALPYIQIGEPKDTNIPSLISSTHCSSLRIIGPSLAFYRRTRKAHILVEGLHRDNSSISRNINVLPNSLAMELSMHLSCVVVSTPHTDRYPRFQVPPLSDRCNTWYNKIAHLCVDNLLTWTSKLSTRSVLQ
jgi:hypothetical protein